MITKGKRRRQEKKAREEGSRSQTRQAVEVSNKCPKQTLIQDAECVQPRGPLTQAPKTPKTPKTSPVRRFHAADPPERSFGELDITTKRESNPSHSLARPLVHSPPSNSVISFARS